MSKRRWFQFFGVTALVAIGSSLAVAPAMAGAIYRGGFDPILFFGTTEIYIPDSCFGTGYVLVADCQTSGDPVNLLSVTVHDNPAPGIDSLTFVPPAAPAGTVLGLAWDSNGVLQAIDTTPFGPAFGVPGTVFSNADGYDIQMVSGAAPTILNALLGTQTVITPHVNLFALSCGGEIDHDDDKSFVNTVKTVKANDDDEQENQDEGPNDGGGDDASGCTLALVGDPANQAAFVRVVPEPGSLALILGALAASAVVVRRRRQSARAAH